MTEVTNIKNKEIYTESRTVYTERKLKNQKISKFKVLNILNNMSSYVLFLCPLIFEIFIIAIKIWTL